MRERILTCEKIVNFSHKKTDGHIHVNESIARVEELEQPRKHPAEEKMEWS